MNTKEEHKAWHKRCAAMMKRADKAGQYDLAWEMLAHDLGDSEILIALERKYFISRKQATTILECARIDLMQIDAIAS